MERKKMYSKRNGEMDRNHMCPEGYHWVNSHTRRKGHGFKMEYVQGHCAKNTDTKNLKVIRFTTTQNFHTPVIDTIRTIEEQPIQDDSNTNNFEND